MKLRTANGRGALPVLVASAALLLLASCAPEVATSPTPDASEQSPTPTDDSDRPAVDDEISTDRIDAAAAVDIALDAVPGAVVELELEHERTTLVWEVGVLGTDGAGTEVVIDSRGGEVLERQHLSRDSVQSTAPQVTAAEAIDIALDAAEGSVKAMDLDTERGAVVWEVEVIGTGGGTELYIDATNGSIVKHERMS